MNSDRVIPLPTGRPDPNQDVFNFIEWGTRYLQERHGWTVTAVWKSMGYATSGRAVYGPTKNQMPTERIVRLVEICDIAESTPPGQLIPPKKQLPLDADLKQLIRAPIESPPARPAERPARTHVSESLLDFFDSVQADMEKIARRVESRSHSEDTKEWQRAGLREGARRIRELKKFFDI